MIGFMKKIHLFRKPPTCLQVLMNIQLGAYDLVLGSEQRGVTWFLGQTSGRAHVIVGLFEDLAGGLEVINFNRILNAI